MFSKLAVIVADANRPRLHRRSLLVVLAFVAAVLALGAAAALAHPTLSTQHSALSTQQGGQAQSADALSPFEYAINSVIGRHLNVPGAD